ncbi:hypothetical protein CL689_05895 [Candidatus Saccharibacteria bacterium]|nr:hypothetical protein [Candidatus Saccharibacteria bacterium]|tara:strand:+ start:120 stop:554 length:435 start_codon:yes stop_codon:yes gene_type:complete
MADINIKKLAYNLRHRYLTINNVIIAVAFLIAASWVWGSLDMMQRNYRLQSELDYKARELQLTELERDKLSLEIAYYETTEYQELAVRESLGLVRPGERALIMPENTPVEEANTSSVAAAATQPTNLEQWVNFLFGGYGRSIAE